MKSAQTAEFAQIAESATIASAEKATSVRIATFANSALIRSALDAVRAVRNVPQYALNAMLCAKTAVTISSALTVGYASNAAAEKATTAPNAAYVKCALNMSAPAETVVRSAHMSASNAVKNVRLVPRKSYASSAAYASPVSAVKEITAPPAGIAKTVWSMYAPAETDAQNAP